LRHESVECVSHIINTHCCHEALGSNDIDQSHHQKDFAGYFLQTAEPVKRFTPSATSKPWEMENAMTTRY
jgi:hypothetical protein